MIIFIMPSLTQHPTYLQFIKDSSKTSFLFGSKPTELYVYYDFIMILFAIYTLFQNYYKTETFRKYSTRIRFLFKLTKTVSIIRFILVYQLIILFLVI